MAILDIFDKIRDLVPNDFGQELGTNLDTQLPKILNVMILRKSMSFLNYSGGIGGKQVQFQKSISNFLRVFLLIFTMMLLFLILAEPSANPETIIKVILELPAIHQHGETNILLLIQTILNNLLKNPQSLILTVLQHQNRDVSILVEDEVELELRTSWMQLVEWDEGRYGCL